MKRHSWLIYLGILFAPGSVWAAGWVDCFSPTRDRSTLNGGECTTWTETGTADSSMLTVNAEGTACDNTGTEPWVVWRANCDTAIATNIWWSTTDGGDCSDTLAADCGTVEIPPGCYILIPSATGASATCKAGPGNN